jgi:two-component system, NarL family, response regulator LiaR
LTIRVFLIDDHPVVRAGLRALLEMEPDLDVVGEAGDGMSGINLVRKLRPDIVVTDILLPDIDGVAVTQTIRAELAGTHVVILTSVIEDDAFVVRAVRAGAIGYVMKNADIDALVQAIRSAAGGQVHLSPRAAARLMLEMRSPSKPVPLTDRERQVLQEVMVGRTNKQIARSLIIAETTVKSHLSGILDKLDVQSRTEAAVYALRSGMFSAAEIQAA